MARRRTSRGLVDTRALNSEEDYRNRANFDSVSHQIRAWLDDDINTRGYAGMTDAQVSVDMTDIDLVDTQRESINGAELFEQTDSDELEALRNGTHLHGDAVGNVEKQEKDYYMWSGEIADSTKIFNKSGPIVNGVLRAIWGNQSQSWQNFVDYFNEAYKIDRGTWLINRVVTEQDVATARAL